MWEDFFEILPWNAPTRGRSAYLRNQSFPSSHGLVDKILRKEKDLFNGKEGQWVLLFQ